MITCADANGCDQPAQLGGGSPMLRPRLRPILGAATAVPGVPDPTAILNNEATDNSGNKGKVCTPEDPFGLGSGGPDEDPDDERKVNPPKAESEIWKDATPYRNGLRKHGKEIWDWDNTHNDIEVYNSRGEHLGSRDPSTGEMYKPPVSGRKIPL